MQFPRALVVSTDPVLAALIAALAELADAEVAFPQPGEGARDALRRVRPVLVLADCDREEAASESFIGPALMTGARLGVFCSARHVAHERTRLLADRHGIAFFVLPEDSAALEQWVAATVAASRQGRRSVGG